MLTIKYAWVAVVLVSLITLVTAYPSLDKRGKKHHKKPHKSKPQRKGSSEKSLNDLVDNVSDALGDVVQGVISGLGTFFHPDSDNEGGNWGACGPRESDHSNIVAVSIDLYGDDSKKSDWCGRKILIKSGGKKTVAIANDCCPTCEKNSLDMTPEVFKRLGKPKTGVIPIDWCACGTKGCDDDECT
ncbi:hypothetical protein BJV82DRAFT_582494 [Fennellomyces sp. T-0311]|nr:hypothetical protein BJV82DRAFT_582494 [Fennellomyces sp. T-0311]